MEVLRQQPPPETNYHMGYNSLSHFDSFSVGHLDSKSQYFPPQAPPTPPYTMARVSLPSIADILNPSTDDDCPPAKRSRYDNLQHHDSPRNQTSVHHQQRQYQSTQRLPPTPPLSTDNARDINGHYLPSLQPIHTSGSSSPNVRRESDTWHDYKSSAASRQQINSHYNNRRSPDLPTPHPLSASTQTSHPYRRSPEFRSGRRSQSPQDTSRPAGKRPSLPLPNGPRSPHSYIKEEPHGSRSNQEFLTHRSPGAHDQLPALLNKTPSPYPSVSTHRSMPSDFSVPAPFNNMSQQQTQQSYSPHSSPPTQRIPSFSRPRSESWSGRQHPRSVSHTNQVSPRLQHSTQPLAQVLSSQSAGSSDRYICSTCGKCFSRPSSLRIHSHSHTGEKPFRCSREGCGKAFSVRSNMKRHERGCHVGIVAPPPGYPHASMCPVTAPLLPHTKTEHLGLGVTGLPSIASGMPPLPRELAPALDT